MSVEHFIHRPPLRLHTKLSYGAGSVAYGVAFAGLSGAVLQIYLNQVLGLPALLVGTTIMVSLMADAVLDPFIGQWSDRVRSRWGRRHPFMYASAVPVALFFYLLWNAPRGLSGEALIAFTLAMMIAVRVSVSLYEIPSNALTPELTVMSLLSIAALSLYRIDRRTHERNLETLRDSAAVAAANHGVEALASGDAAVPVITTT